LTLPNFLCCILIPLYSSSSSSKLLFIDLFLFVLSFDNPKKLTILLELSSSLFSGFGKFNVPLSESLLKDFLSLKID
jgi:hypothetical protein